MDNLNYVNYMLEKRIKEMSDWLESSWPEIAKDQKHLDSCTPERAYWHYGYLMALRDVLRLIKGDAD